MTRGLLLRAGWGRTILIVLVALGLAWLGFAFTVSLGKSREDPTMALELWTSNSLAHAAMAAQIAAETYATRPSPEARRHAIASLMDQPGNPVAARIMGVTAGLSQDRQGLARWLAYSERYSRRDLGVQLAQIELAVEQGRINETLVHYDRALRVFAPQPGLIDVLVSATSLIDVRRPLVAMLRRNPPWRQSYLIQLVESGHASVETIYATLRGAHLDSRQAFDRRILSEAVALFVSQKRLAMAHALIGRIAIGVHNGAFEEANLYPPLDWKLADTTDLSGVIEQGTRQNGGNALFVNSSNGAAGVIAEQVLSLMPGNYDLSALSGDGPATAAEAPVLTVTCLGSDAIVATIPLPTGKDITRRFRLRFLVPANCPNQRLAIAATSISGLDAVRPWIDDVVVSQLPR